MQGCIRIALLMLDDADSADFVGRWANADDRHVAERRGAAAGARRTLAGRALLRMLLAEEPPPPGGVWHVVPAESGKPRLQTRDGLAGPPVSISHSRDLVAAALGRSGEIGIDVEYRDARRSLDEIARTAFGPREIAEAAAAPERFYRIWTLREAMAKAGGAGLRQAANGIDCVAGSPPEGAWSRPVSGGEVWGGEVWHFAGFEPVPGYSLALALREDADAPCLHWSADAIDIRRLPADPAGG